MKLYSPSTIRDIKERYGFRLSKSLGQNFLTDKNIIDRIIEGSQITENDLVIEIGPGVGVITREAAAAASKVIAVEIDSNLIPILEETLGDLDNVEVINRDILKTDLNRLIEEEKAANPQITGVRIIGNLPYYITTPIIMKILEDGVKADSMTVMMQKEVGDRIMAEEGSKARGALSVAVQYYCTVEKIVSVPKDVFVPAPKVDSIVLRLDIRKEKAVDLEDDRYFFRAVKSGFGQRRKTLLNSLSSEGNFSKEEIGEILQSAGIDPKRRAETLSMDEFADIANLMKRKASEK